MLLHLITKTRDDIDVAAARASARAARTRGRLTNDELASYNGFIDGVVAALAPTPPHWAGRILLHGPATVTVATCVYVNENSSDDHTDWVGNAETIGVLTPDFFEVLGIRIDRSTGLYETVPTTYS